MPSDIKHTHIYILLIQYQAVSGEVTLYLKLLYKYLYLSFSLFLILLLPNKARSPRLLCNSPLLIFFSNSILSIAGDLLHPLGPQQILFIFMTRFPICQIYYQDSFGCLTLGSFRGQDGQVFRLSLWVGVQLGCQMEGSLL